MFQIAARPGEAGKLSQTRCDRGAQIARSIGSGEKAAECIAGIEEYWNGSGTTGLKKDALSIFGRIGVVAQCLEVFTGTLRESDGVPRDAPPEQ